jgi:hypothetical protein
VLLSVFSLSGFDHPCIGKDLRPHPVVLPLLYRNRAWLTEVVHVDPIGLSRTHGGDRRDDRYGEGDRTDMSGTLVEPGGATAANKAGRSAVMVVPTFCEIAIAETRVRVWNSSGQKLGKMAL